MDFLNDLLQQVSSLYELESISNCLKITTAPVNFVFKLEALQHGQAKTWCLKGHRADVAPEQIVLSAKLQNDLADTGFNLIPKLVPNKNGDLNFAYNNQMWDCCEFVDADPPFDINQSPAWTKEQCFSAGAALACWHIYGNNWLKRDDNEKRCSASILQQLPDLLSNAFVNVQNKAIENMPSSISKIISTQDKLQIDLARTIAGIKNLANSFLLEKQLVHGDYHPGNLLFKGEKVKAVIDFDYAHIECPAYDIAYALLFFGHDFAESFISGYCNARVGEKISAATLMASVEIEQYQKVACYLCLYWLLDQFAENNFTSYTERASTRMLGALSRLSMV